MSSEYDPLLAPPAPVDDDLDRVQGLFAEAARPFLSSPWSWLAWAVVLPAAALATAPVAAARGAAGVLFLWSAAVLAGGLVEGLSIARRRPRNLLGSWALRAQGNLSLVAVAVSFALVWADRAWLLPAVWLLLLGHSLYILGGLAFPAMATAGLVYQAGGVAALVVGRPLVAFAIATATANLWIALAIYRERAGGRADDATR